MDLTHEFTVAAGVEDTWNAIADIASVAGCFPGAVVTGVEGDSFEGSVKVKLGPIALVYNGAGHFVSKDEATRTMKIEAKGKDKRGNGTAGADVKLTMTESDGGTTVVIVTDLAITGKPAQFGRGVIQDVSDKLLGQFVDCLQQRMTTTEADEAAPDAPAADASAADASAAATAAAEVGGPVPDGPGPSGARPPGTPSAAAGGDDALDLGSAVLPVIAKTYGKQIVAGLGVLLLVVWLVRRRTR